MDIEPGDDDDNEIDPGDDDDVRVAVLGSMDFDATQVNGSTVRFGPSEAAAKKCKVKDTNDDGAMDLVCKFDVRDTGIECGDTQANLVAATFGGESIFGTDSFVTDDCDDDSDSDSDSDSG